MHKHTEAIAATFELVEHLLNLLNRPEVQAIP